MLRLGIPIALGDGVTHNGSQITEPLRRSKGQNIMTTAAIASTRNANNVTIMVPVSIPRADYETALNHLQGQGINITNAQPAPRTRRTYGRRKTTVKVVHKVNDAGKVGPGRGKQPGRYVVNPSVVASGKEPANMTASINALWYALKNNKRGLMAKALAERLKMPSGTVAWGLTQLQKQGVIQHVPPGKQVRGGRRGSAEPVASKEVAAAATT